MKDKPHIDLNDLLILKRVVEHGGVSAASRALGIPKSTLSQRVAALERSVGTGLLRRTSRSHSLTEVGRRLLPYAEQIDRCARDAEASILQLGAGVAGSLRLSCSVAVSQFALGPLLPKFLREHPRVNVEVDTTNRYVDLIGEDYDIGIRAHGQQLKDSTLRQRVVARTPWSLAAAPSFLSYRGSIARPEDLTDVGCLFFNTTRQADSIWPLSRDGLTTKVRVSPMLQSDDMALLRMAAIDGMGVVCLPTYILGPALRTGSLVPVLPEWTGITSQISTLSPAKAQTSPLAKALSDFLSRELSESLESWRGVDPPA